MYLKLISCKVLQREIASITYRCPNTIDITFMKQGFHDIPEKLKSALQEEIDRIDEQVDPHTDSDHHSRPLDGILLGYGLCSNAVVGLRSRKHRLIIPRAHDCTTLVLGSKETYQHYFETYKGSYFFTRGWLELGNMFSESDEQVLERKRKEFMEQYDDEDTVDYLIEMEREMIKNYNTITYVEWPELADEATKKRVRDVADDRKWNFYDVEGNNSLLEDMLNGNWDPERFQIVEPGETVSPSYDEMIMRVKK